MALISSVWFCNWFSFFFKRERSVFQNQCRTTLTPSWGRQGNLHKRKPGEHTWQAAWICELSPKWERLPFAEVCKSRQGARQDTRLACGGLGAGMRRKRSRSQNAKPSFSSMFPLIAPSGGTRERDSPVQVLGVASEAPEKFTLWIRMTDPLCLLPTQYPLKSFTYISSFTLITLGVDALDTHMYRPADGHNDF